MFAADVEVARGLLQRVQQRIVEQTVGIRIPPLQEHLSWRREVRNVDVATHQLVNGSCTVPSVPVPEMIEKCWEFFKLCLQLRSSDC